MTEMEENSVWHAKRLLVEVGQGCGEPRPLFTQSRPVAGASGCVPSLPASLLSARRDKNRGRGGWERNEPAAWARRLLLSHYPTPAVPLRVSGSQRSRGDQRLDLRQERQARHPKPCRLLVAVYAN